MSHLDEGLLHALLDGEIPSSELGTVQQHLDTCADCRVRLDEARALRDEADGLVAAIELPTAPKVPRLETAAVVTRERFGPRFRRLAWAASVVGAAGLGYAVRGPGTSPQVASGPRAADARGGAPAAVPESLFAKEQVAPPPTQPAATDERRDTTVKRQEAAQRPRGNARGAEAERRVGLETPLARAAPSAASSVAADALGKVVARGADAGPTVRGRIVGETGTPVQGAIVRIAELDVEASTDSSGRYVLTVPADSLLKPVTLTARRLGFRAATRMIPEVGERGRTEDFRLRPEGIRLEDVVVTGAAADQTAFRPVEFLDAVALLGGTIRLIDGLIPTGLEAARNDVRVVYRIGGREVHLTQRREGGAVTFTLSGPPDFPADSLALLRARVRE